ncbi:MAG: 5-formyltetrahydrofolate cyclo-ligase [bacterium]|nr:5-formyltetrahydrofolate cyclo-ligase [bacterium]
MRPLDIRVYKTQLREKVKKSRSELDSGLKASMDSSIADNVRRLYQYKNCSTVLAYSSTKIEVGTKKIIENAWADGKKVALPRCIPGTFLMEFHYITGFDQLEKGTFSVLEPTEDLPVVDDFKGCLMLIPGLMFDRFGYRLGYGKGYYDRYMSRFTGITVGICYSDDIMYRMYHGIYDRPVSNFVI